MGEESVSAVELKLLANVPQSARSLIPYSGLCQLAGLTPLEYDGDDDGDDDGGDEDDDHVWKFIKDSFPPAAVPCNTCYPLMTDTRLYSMLFLPSTVSDEYKLIEDVTARELVISLQVLIM